MTDSLIVAKGTSLPVQPAEVNWTENGGPFSCQFGDIYFSRQNGLAETRYVFLEKNNLPERLIALVGTKNPRFCIGETGFGTGLNFLSAWQLRDHIIPDCHLHYTSVEKFPLTKDDLAKALSYWAELYEYAGCLVEHYPPLTPGWHHLSFTEQRVDLNLYLGDALEGYEDYQGTVDAWFLDGFAPAKNPPMWTEALIQQIARLSNNDTSFSTFTAASSVREGLKKAGFEVNRNKGFGNKRHMLCGKRLDKSTTKSLRTQFNSRQLSSPWFIADQPSFNDEKKAIVIGGGLAGTSAAFSLARRGWQVNLIDRHEQLGNEASGNRQGILYNKLSAEPSLNSAFYTAGYLYSQRQFAQLTKNNGQNWHHCGVLQLAYDDQEALRQAHLIEHNPQPDDLIFPVTASQASELAGVSLHRNGLYSPVGGWAAPASICADQASHPNIKLTLGVQVEKIVRDNEHWLLLDATEKLIACSKILIIANAKDSNHFEVTRNLPLKAIRGQTTDIPANPEVALKTVLCGKSYIGPAIDGRHYMGATFDLNCVDTECRTSDHYRNLEHLITLAPELAEELGVSSLQQQNIQGRVGFRCTTLDYLPLVGPVPEQETFLNYYAPLRKSALHKTTLTGAYYPGLYLTTGHGSKGLTSCPLAGEILAAYINQEPFPISTELAHALNPSRFLIRDLKRNKI